MKWLKKMLKYLLIFIGCVIGVIAILAAVTIINTTWRTEKFRFENFKTGEELIAYIKANYPNGSDSKPLIILLENAGARYEEVSKKYYSNEDEKIGTQSLYRFYYNAGWLYYPQSMAYVVILSLDKNQRLLNSRATMGYVGL